MQPHSSHSREQGTSPRHSETNSPIPAFDHQLKTLGDSYIAFFHERIRIEETYVDSMFRLHRNTRALDNLLDDREPSSMRVAWREIRDNIEREAETRMAFYTSLKTEILPALHALKETQERTRKRIKEDLRDATVNHVEYAENVLPKLKRTYLRKCQDVEDYKQAERPSTAQSATSVLPIPATSPRPPTPGNSTAPSSDHSPPRASFERISSNVVASPTPSHPSTVPGVAGRNRSPSTTTSLSDLAHQGKKGLNQLMGFLNDPNRERGGIGGSMREGPGGAPTTLRSVRAKREADESNKEYRKGVHRLETLRLRRVKTLEAGYNSLVEFVNESGLTLQKALSRYVDCLTVTCSTQSHLVDHAHSAVSKISTQKDLDRVHNFVIYAFSRVTPPRILYYNYHVGECSDLVFGVSLVDYATARNTGSEAPSLVQKCIKEIEERGVTAEGIYRVSGRHANVQELTHKIERNERNFNFDPVTDDVYVVASLLKLYLRELPEPVFKFPLAERLQHTEDREDHINNGFLFLRSKIRRIPPVHQSTLRAIVEHLAVIASHSAQNKMDSRNLAIVFGAVIFGEDEMPKGGDVLSIQSWKDTVMEDFITYAGLLFDDQNVPPSVPKPTTGLIAPSISTSNTNFNASSLSPPSPPLPLPPSEPPSAIDYGSSFTRITSLPPRSSVPNSIKDKEVTHIPTVADFTPQLPFRPQHSIHPSRRANSLREDGTSEEYSAEETISSSRRPSAILVGARGDAASSKSSLSPTKATFFDAGNVPFPPVPRTPTSPSSRFTTDVDNTDNDPTSAA